MGTNKRYADAIDKRSELRQLERAMREERPTTLTQYELELDDNPVTTTRQPVAVRVWVRYPAVVSKIEARAIAWTPRAVKVEWDTPTGQVHTAWVWASAVERL
jgi:hypothetical protein